MIVKSMSFPIAVVFNLFSFTFLLIFSGFIGKATLSADIAIAQGAIVAVFFSLSGNARNLILSSSAGAEEYKVFYFRLLCMFPASILVFLLIKHTVDTSNYLIIGLILRKCSEWIVELNLANKEKKDDYKFALSYIGLNVFALLILLVSILIDQTEIFYSALYFWAVMPLFFSFAYLSEILKIRNVNFNFLHLMPHLGASSIIGASTYMFRVLVVILAGKIFAGQLFTAFALGGVISSVFSQAFGPSLMLKRKTRHYIILFMAVSLCFLLGAIFLLLPLFWEIAFYTPEFIKAIGYSFLGGGIMIFAQWQRIYILQVLRVSVFVPDALANILLLLSIPLIYFLIGEVALPFLFLFSAVLNFAFYLPLIIRSNLESNIR